MKKAFNGRGDRDAVRANGIRRGFSLDIQNAGQKINLCAIARIFTDLARLVTMALTIETLVSSLQYE